MADVGRAHEADGVVTAQAGLTLMVQGADCPLVLLIDPAVPALALVHSGWRGTRAGVGAAGVAALRGLGGSAARIVAGVFPGIGACCYEVGDEVRRAFEEAFGARAGAWFEEGRLDLRAAIVATLADEGVAPGRIDVVPGCTACGGRLWSHRASGGAPERHGLFARLTVYRATGRADSSASP
jgi:YfiH family protein